MARLFPGMSFLAAALLACVYCPAQTNVRPEYTPEARAAGLQGSVMLRLEVGADGAVTTAHVVRGLGMGLDQTALAAAKQWHYEPLPDGRAQTRLEEVPFQLDPPGPWRVVGSGFELPLSWYPKANPVLAGYVAPEAAACTKERAWVVVGVHVGKDGRPSNVRIETTDDARMNQAVLAAVRSWTFSPGTVNGNPESAPGSVLLECRAHNAPEVPYDGRWFDMKKDKAVKRPTLLLKVEPDYTPEAAKAKLTGAVMLQLVVDSEGHPRDIHVLRRVGLGLDEAAVAAVSLWRFRPGTREGDPANVRVTVSVNFVLLQ